MKLVCSESLCVYADEEYTFLLLHQEAAAGKQNILCTTGRNAVKTLFFMGNLYMHCFQGTMMFPCVAVSFDD